MAQNTVLSMARVEVEEKLKKRIEIGNQLLTSLSSETYMEIKDEISIWSDYNVKLLKSICNTDELANGYTKGSFTLGGRVDIHSLTKDLRDDVSYKIRHIKSVIERLELIPESPSLSSKSQTSKTEFGNKVFIVHGHDDGAKFGVARYIEKLGLEAIILDEQSNQGRTVIEKFEAHAAEVGFALVLLTPDDLGETKANISTPQARARQNVIFELGFFFGKLGRGRVCALLKGDVELPSDFAGIVWVSMTGNWQLQVARGMKVAGLPVDLNKLT